MLMVGERDNVIGNAREVADRTRRLIPQVQVEIIPRVGHMMNAGHLSLFKKNADEIFRALVS